MSINESKHAIGYTYSKYARTRLSRTKRDTIWTKHQLNQESTKQILSRAKGSKRYKEDKRELDQGKPWQQNKAIQSKNQHEDGLQVPPLF